nr:hypothetical protein [Bradyrhizobium agreste]
MLRYDGMDTTPTHQPLDPPPAGASPRLAQGGMNARTAVAAAALLMELPDRSQERDIGFCPLTQWAIVPGIIASRRDLEHGAHQPHRIGIAVGFQ